MYSRIPRQPPGSLPPGMPSYRSRVTLPPNYSGNVFSRETPAQEPAEPRPTAEVRPRFDGLPAVSNLPSRTADLPDGDMPDTDERIPGTAEEEQVETVAVSARPTEAAVHSSIFLDRAHFPLGHGLGEEELLLLGLILLLLHEDGGISSEGENDLLLTVLLLGFLLFCG